MPQGFSKSIISTPSEGPAWLVFNLRIMALGLAGAFLLAGAAAQNPPASASNGQTAKCDNQIRSTYLLGPDDQLDISAPELTDLNNKPVRIDGQGDIAVPLAGSVHAIDMVLLIGCIGGKIQRILGWDRGDRTSLLAAGNHGFNCSQVARRS